MLMKRDSGDVIKMSNIRIKFTSIDVVLVRYS